jgi:hypothetical protein
VADADLAELCAALQIRQRFRQRFKLENPVDDYRHAVLFERPQHRLETVAMADGNALQPHLPGDDQAERRRQRGAREHTDHRQGAAGTNAAQRLWQGFLAAKLDDVVEAATIGERTRRFRPFGSRPVVDRRVGTERLESLDLLVARGDHGDPCAGDPGKRQREQRDAAGALDQYLFAGLDRAVRGQTALQAVRAAQGSVAASTSLR